MKRLFARTNNAGSGRLFARTNDTGVAIALLSAPAPANNSTVGKSPTISCLTDVFSGNARIVIDLTANLDAVTYAQVMAGHHDGNANALLDSGLIAINSATISHAFTNMATGAYTVAVAHASRIIKWTLNIDASAPNFSTTPTPSTVGSTTATIGATSSEAGSARLILTAFAATQPLDATFDSSTFSAATLANAPFTINYTGAPAGTLARAWMQIQDNFGNRATSSTVVLFSPAGFSQIVVGTPNPNAEKRVTATPVDIASGDLIAVGNIVGSGIVVFYSDSSFYASAGVTSFDYRVGTLADGWGNSATQPLVDNIAPSLLSAAVVENRTGSGFRLRFTPSEPVTLRVAVYYASSTAPSAASVIAGTGSPSWLSSALTNAGNIEQIIDVAGLAGGPFTAYVALLDSGGNPALIPISNIALVTDTSPPLVAAPPEIEIAETSLVVKFTADKDGQWRVLALHESAATPSPEEVFAGTGADGEAALRDTGLQPLLANIATPAILVALEAGRSYRLALGLRDGGGNAQVIMIDSQTAPLAVVPNITLQVVLLDSSTVRLTASANVALASLSFQLNGTRVGPVIVAAPYVHDLDMSSLDSQVYQIKAQANLGGNEIIYSLPATVFVAQPELSIGDVFFDEEYGTPKATAQQAFTDLVTSFGIPTNEIGMRAEWEKQVAKAGVGINNDSAYSPFWRLISAIVTTPALFLVNLLINGLLPNYFVKYARGTFLEIAAWGVNLERKLKSKTQGTIRFVRSDASIVATISAGTLIETVPINNKVYRVLTKTDAVINEGVALLDIAVEAEESGSQHNLAAGYYSIISPPVAGVSATNVSGWITKPGADEESDDELRLRIKNQFGTVSGHHIDAVYKAIISENQGISVDRIYFEHDAPRGPGTANAYILFDVGDNPTPYIDALNAHIIDGAEHGLGDDFLVLPMPETEHDLIVTGYALASLSSGQKAELESGIEQFVRAAFRETDAYPTVSKVLPQSRFSFSQLGKELHQQFPGLESIAFSLPDIVSAIDVPRLNTLEVNIL